MTSCRNGPTGCVDRAEPSKRRKLNGAPFGVSLGVLVRTATDTGIVADRIEARSDFLVITGPMCSQHPWRIRSDPRRHRSSERDLPKPLRECTAASANRSFPLNGLREPLGAVSQRSLLTSRNCFVTSRIPAERPVHGLVESWLARTALRHVCSAFDRSRL